MRVTAVSRCGRTRVTVVREDMRAILEVLDMIDVLEMTIVPTALPYGHLTRT